MLTTTFFFQVLWGRGALGGRRRGTLTSKWSWVQQRAVIKRTQINKELSNKIMYPQLVVVALLVLLFPTSSSSLLLSILCFLFPQQAAGWAGHTTAP